ncbi:MAG: hypothetical protein JXN59_01150 [Anaerolineae bacterium]|nr:hypothetical protein [Anaerolineae bacterium]
MFNLKVAILDTDFYALQAITGYLALDRRTRVIKTAETRAQLFNYLAECSMAELPDVILLDADHAGSPELLQSLVEQLYTLAPAAMVICLAQMTDAALVTAAARAGARGYFLKGDVRLQISWAIVFTCEHEFVVTQRVRKQAAAVFEGRFFRATTLPAPRHYPELTARVQQAIRLCVLEGMPAQLAADEMGISPHTVRSYIKEGYRILEAYNDIEFPVDMTAQERAFYRFTVPEGWHGSFVTRHPMRSAV